MVLVKTFLLTAYVISSNKLNFCGAVKGFFFAVTIIVTHTEFINAAVP